MRWVQTSQYARAGGADERADRHVGVGRTALVAVEAFSVQREARHLSQQFQVFLLLFALRTRRHAVSTRAAKPKSEAVRGGRRPGTDRLES